MCSLLSKEGNFHIESQPGSGDLDLTPSQSPLHGKWKCIHVYWIECITQMWAVFASWKQSEIAVCCCWQTNWVHAGKNIYKYVVIYIIKIKRKTENSHKSSDLNNWKSPTNVKPSGTATNEILISPSFPLSHVVSLEPHLPTQPSPQRLTCLTDILLLFIHSCP